jgi:serine phosphatase RsbU (regulator of sigma subunit)
MKNIFDVLFSRLPLTTLKAKFIFSFSIYFLLVLLIIFSFYWFDNQKTKFNQVAVILYQINNNLKKADNVEKDFFSHENINPEFYKSDGKSSFILKHKILFRKIQKDLYNLKFSPHVIENEIDNDIDSLSILLNKYSSVFDTLTNLQKIRGFKDYGLEGKMRSFIHKLEGKEYGINQIELLTTRRHEKDFLLRKENIYIERWQAVTSKIIQNVTQQNESKMKEEALLILDNYKNAFLDLTVTEQRIGYNNESGLRGQISNLSAGIERKLDEIDKKIVGRIEQLIQGIQFQILALIIICVVLNILLATTVYRKLSRPIKRLSNSIHAIIKTNFSEQAELYEYRSNDEIGSLARDFKFMLNSLRLQTKELQITNSELFQQKEEIIAQRDNIENFSKQLLKINNDMTASINYAKRIQNALLSFEKKMNSILPEHFILFKPKDIVSGDFYWFAEKGDKAIIAVVDCTGHGVPGAFMSMIGNTLLNQIVHDREIHEPHLILNELHKGVWQTLRLEGSEIKDGMDISLCVINKTKQLLSFAGARHPIFIIQNNGFQLVTSNKVSIGESAEYEYAQQTFAIGTSPTTFYIFSDGYADQFGGAIDKKFSIRQLKDLLFSIHTQDMEAQKAVLTQTLEDWQGNYKQTDDILLVGFKI